MSCDWNVKCVDCDSVHPFCDANHRVDLMHSLIRHAAAVAALDPLMQESTVAVLELRTSFGVVDTAWFAEHAGHRLAPVSEYGDLDQAAERPA